jgi:hypothetical protein
MIENIFIILGVAKLLFEIVKLIIEIIKSIKK